MEVICHAMLFADKVITEKNGKKGLIGIFSRLFFNNLPARPLPWYIYLSLTNIIGKHDFSINLICDENQQAIFSVSGELEAPNLNTEIEIDIPVHNVQFPKQGIYNMIFYLNGKQVASKVLQVEVKELKQ